MHPVPVPTRDPQAYLERIVEAVVRQLRDAPPPPELAARVVLARSASCPAPSHTQPASVPPCSD